MDQISYVAETSGLTLRGLQNLLQGQNVAGDAFAMIFQQLLGMGDGELDLMLQQISDMQEQEEEDGTFAAMQMMAEMLFSQSPQAQELLTRLSEEGWNLEELGNAAATVSQELETAATQTEQKAQPMEFDQKLTAEEAETQEEKMTFQQLFQRTQTEENSGDALLKGQNLFRNAVQNAKMQLAAAPNKEEKFELDVEALQADVDSRRFDTSVSGIKDLAAASSSNSDLEKANVVDQLKTGILDGLSKHEGEFVLKLKPEGLGEITIKMQEHKDGLTLSLLTSNEQVTRLIANEVATLQNALKPLHVEVQEIATAVSETAAQQSALDQQSFQQQQFTDRNPASHSSQNRGGSQEDTEEWIQEPQLEEIGLRRYV